MLSEDENRAYVGQGCFLEVEQASGPIVNSQKTSKFFLCSKTIEAFTRLKKEVVNRTSFGVTNRLLNFELGFLSSIIWWFGESKLGSHRLRVRFCVQALSVFGSPKIWLLRDIFPVCLAFRQDILSAYSQTWLRLCVGSKKNITSTHEVINNCNTCRCVYITHK